MAATPFEQWFSSDWLRALHEVPDDREVLASGQSIRTASWDRRAAYLTWTALGRPAPAWVERMAAARGAAPDNDLADLLGAAPPAAPVPDDLGDLLG